MGFFKNIYYFFEDRWYDVLDKINNHLPIYKIIDPIDKVVPSFILFLLLILFVLVLLGYLVEFTSPYEVTFTAMDSKTKERLSAVNISGTINEEAFSEKTDSKGSTVVSFLGSTNNLYDLLGQMIFSSAPDLNAVLTVKKQGYDEWKNKNILLTSKKYDLLLSQIKIGLDYLNSAQVVLVDRDTQDAISASQDSYVTFNCHNKDITPKKVHDKDDGTLDGKFVLNEPSCQFTVIEAFAPTYELSRDETILPLIQTVNNIPLTKTFVPTTGKAKIYAIEEGATPKKNIQGIVIRLINELSANFDATTNFSGEASFDELVPGKYKLTAFSPDSNYYPITIDANITLDIVLNQTTTKELSLRKMNSSDARIVNIKVVDSNNTPIYGAQLSVYGLSTDANGITTAGESKLGVCVDNYFRAKSCITDINGLLIVGGLDKNKEGNVVGVIFKSNYLYKIFKPTLFRLGGGPETITLALASELNSGKAKVKVKSKQEQYPLFEAQTSLYLNSAELNIRRIKINSSPVLTNFLGESDFSYLLPGTYAAKADFEESTSGFSQTKDIDANQLVIFDLNIDINASYLQIELLDGSSCYEGLCSKISDANAQSAVVKIAKYSDTDFSNKVDNTENTLSYSTANKYFKSVGYPKSSLLGIDITVPNFAPAFIAINGIERPLSPKANIYKLKLYPLSMLDGNVSVFFDNIYDAGDNPWSGISTTTILTPGNEYYTKFDAVVARGITYTELLALSRVNSSANITNIIPTLFNHSLSKMFKFTTGCFDAASGLHDDNYYLPLGDYCNELGEANKQSGSDWARTTLARGTYSFIAKVRIDSNATSNDKLVLKYRAKEKNTRNTSETPLKTESFDINKPLRYGILVTITLNEQSYHVLLDNTALSSPTGTNTILQKSALLPSQVASPLIVNIYNNTDNSYSGGKLTIFSYAGLPSAFDPTSTGSGRIHFDNSSPTASSPLYKDLLNPLALLPRRSLGTNTSAFAERYNSTNWVILSIALNGKTYNIFVDAKSKGKKLSVDSEFLAGVVDQLFDGTVYTESGATDLTLDSVSISVKKNCLTSQTPITQTNVVSPYPPNILGNSFNTTIKGVYASRSDCVDLIISANDLEQTYETLNKRVYASIESLDPSLACVDAYLPQGTISSESGFASMILDWNNKTNLIITNTCPAAVNVKLESGLICKMADGRDCSISTLLSTGSSITFQISGINADYIPTQPKPNLTDTLGFFPIYVKAKYTTAVKKYVTADKAEIHLVDPAQCFTISKDKFDLIAQSSEAFNLHNSCQSTMIPDHFIPKATVDTFGFDINYTGKPNFEIINFSPTLITSGNTFSTRYVDYNINTCWSFVNKSHPTPTTTDANFGYYSNLNFDLSGVPGQINLIQFKFIDINNLSIGNPAAFGAVINGSIKINYKNNTSITKSLNNNNFSISPSLHCLSPGSAGVGNVCEINDAHTICELGEDYDNDGNQLTFGILYIPIPTTNGAVGSVDLNLIGNKNSNNLTVHVLPRTVLTRQRAEAYSTGTSIQNATPIGSYSIPALEGVSFIIKKIDELSAFNSIALSAVQNPISQINSNNPNIVVWVDGSYLKAAYVGTDVSEFNNKNFPATMVKTPEGKGINYGIVTVVDYVDPALSGVYKISGAN